MYLFYIRHGQSSNNALYDVTGNDAGRVVDPLLTPAGMLQAERVAEMLRCGRPLTRSNGDAPEGFGITHLYCSLMTRAVQTGQAISRVLGLPLQGWTDLHEGGGMYLEDPDTGALTGKPGATRAELERRCPELVWPADAREDGWWNRPFEPAPDRTARAHRVLAELLDRHGGGEDRVAFVSHGGFFYRFMCAMLGLQDPPDVWFHMCNTGIACLEFSPDGSRGVRYQNRVDHLPAELIT